MTAKEPSAAPVFSSGYGMETCPTHHRWIKIERADGTTADRRVGDWIIRGVAGEFYPCKPAIFEETYEPVA